MSEMTLHQWFLKMFRDKTEQRFVPMEYVDDYWALVAFSDGYFAARPGQSDPSWDAFELWLSKRKIVEGSEGWRLAIPRLAELEGRPPAEVLFDLLVQFEQQRGSDRQDHGSPESPGGHRPP